MRQLLGVIAMILCALATNARADTLDHPYVAVSAEELFDSNVNNSRGPDAVSRLTPEIGWLHLGPTTQIFLDYKLALHAYAFGAADSSVNHRGEARLTTELAPHFTLTTGGVLLIASDPILLDRPGVAVPTGPFDDLTTSIAVLDHVTRRFTLDAAYGFRLTRFQLASEMPGAAFNGDEHDVELGAAYRATRRLDMGAKLLGSDFITYGGGVGSLQTIAPVLSIGWRASRRLRLQAQAGPMWTFDRSITWIGGGRLVWEGRRLHGTIDVSRSIFGGTGADSAVWSDWARAALTWRFHRRSAFRMILGGFSQGAAPDGPATVNGLSARAELGFLAFGKFGRIDIYAEERLQDATGGVAFTNINRTVVGVRLVAVTGASLIDLGEAP
jgi:hypothetical protein